MTTARTQPCPQCGTPAELSQSNPWRPFCSKRCKLIDLGDWMTERHGIPAEDETVADGGVNGDDGEPQQ